MPDTLAVHRDPLSVCCMPSEQDHSDNRHNPLPCITVLRASPADRTRLTVPRGSHVDNAKGKSAKADAHEKGFLRLLSQVAGQPEQAGASCLPHL